MTWTDATSATTPSFGAIDADAATWAAPTSPTGTWNAEGSDAATWTTPFSSYASGNFSRMIDADPLIDASGGIDFNNTFSTENPWVFTTRGPVGFREDREEPV